MANAVNGNTIYVDTAGALSDQKNTSVKAIIVSASGGPGLLVLQNNNSNIKDNKVSINAPDNTTVFIRLDDAQMAFPDGVYAATVTNCVATLILNRSGGS